jgi:hypothetical protein
MPTRNRTKKTRQIYQAIQANRDDYVCTFRRAAMFFADDAKGVCLDMIPAYFTGYGSDV